MTNGKTDKRQRQKEGRRARIEQQLRAQRARRQRRTALLVGLLALTVVGVLAQSQNRDREPAAADSAPQFATLVTSKGDIKVKLLPETAPKTVENFVGLATGQKEYTDPLTQQLSTAPFYNGTIFHRVIPDFMIQGGDRLGTGTGGPGYQFEDETEGGPTFEKPGMLAMANSGPNTNGSQFFITVATPTHLNGKHTIFGEVVEGQAVADEISKVPTEADKPLEDVVIREVRITSD
jgi:peptidyl-prolyl cis-trans isomerase A (cyclophilin A)